ncbi:FAD-linked oxidase C-terminal domain-containing protein [Micromonospora soli]|uniref:FAD-binding oxidoreductase n=1 Tax=Micromonospora sp. NBRC 110009 TaxID=3061627 RepID=UPI0026719E1E|nr:FAD-linked oxidase C-terminal domain-containing protein [Micromonospora sp. NBRC 110009]WKT96932.1 FAD-linked oxidase C-terminal domain-containing protein [Micromonospora sp. NBRC 110009]
MGDVQAVLAQLAAELGPGAVLTDPDVVRTYSTDAARFCPVGTAAGLVRVRSTAEVSTVLRLASQHRVPVVPQGARTGLAGGANAIDGCLLLSLERMDQILAIDSAEQIAVVQPGVVNAALSAAVAERDLYYPPDPASWESSTIGGNVATNAGGLCCVKYGVTGDWVRGLEVVLADGSVLHTGRATAKGVAGYDLTHLFVGSEGTLGVVTEVTMSLRPKANTPLTAAAIFTDIGAACTAVNDYLSSGVRPSLLELMDGPTIEVVSAYRELGFPPGTEAVLIAQSDDEHRAAADLDAFAEVCRRVGADEVVVADDPAEGKLLIEARRLVGPAHESVGTDLVDDVCVPRPRLADLLRGVARIGHEYSVLVTCAGHAGDGNMHPAVVFDPADEDMTARALEAFGAIMRLGLDLGGTITGEHGVGLLKRLWLEAELGEVALAAHRSIKQALDPLNILNPGKVLSMGESLSRK